MRAINPFFNVIVVTSVACDTHPSNLKVQTASKLHTLCLLSGTFLAIDISVYMLDATNKTSIERIVRSIRKQRAYSIQMPDQYLFVHQTLIEYALKMAKLVTDRDVAKALYADEQ